MSRDYKDEYEKFQKDKSGYRAKLNKYNRDKGTYGNGDGKDASHGKGGKIVGFKDSSANKGEKEKSRLEGSKRKKYKEGVEVTSNVKKARKIREGLPPLIGKDGIPSTHKMASGIETDKDGNDIHIAYPTLFPNYINYGGKKTFTGKWSDKGMSNTSAFEEAKVRDEVFKFNTKDEAEKFAKGNWKEENYQKGGKMIGPSHDNGGIDINVEGEEIVINKTKNNAAGIHEEELLALNKNPDDYAIVKKSEFNWPTSDARKRGEQNA